MPATFLHDTATPLCRTFARVLLTHDFAPPALWSEAGGRPLDFVRLAWKHWIEGQAKRCPWIDLSLEVQIQDPYSDEHAGSAAIVIEPLFAHAYAPLFVGSLLERYAEHDPRAARAFHDYLSWSLCRWLRVYDHYDATFWVDAQRDKYGLDEEEEDGHPEIPNIEALPSYLGEGENISEDEARAMAEALPDTDLRQGLLDLLALYQDSVAWAPPLDTNSYEGYDGGALPVLVIALYPHDPVVAAADADIEDQLNDGMSHAPNLTLSFDPHSDKSILQAVDTLARLFTLLERTHQLLQRLLPPTAEKNVRPIP